MYVCSHLEWFQCSVGLQSLLVSSHWHVFYLFIYLFEVGRDSLPLVVKGWTTPAERVLGLNPNVLYLTLLCFWHNAVPLPVQLPHSFCIWMRVCSQPVVRWATHSLLIQPLTAQAPPLNVVGPPKPLGSSSRPSWPTETGNQGPFRGKTVCQMT